MPRATHAFTSVSMDTGVNVQVIAAESRERVEAVVRRALAWFETVERICTRFDPTSEVMQLLQHVGTAVPVSTLLFESIAFALDLAKQTDGAFDPTIGASMEQLGFNTNYKTGQAINTPIAARSVDFRDVKLDRRAHTALLRRPLILDLNAVAKGLAIDLAARELEAFADVYVEAGGDVYVRGHAPSGDPWRIGIQHPRAEGLLAHTLAVTDTAVCTSGDYERGGHILDARTHKAVSGFASVTVVAPTAMAADGLSTAAMVLGPERGLDFIREQGVGAVFVTADGGITRVNL